MRLGSLFFAAAIVAAVGCENKSPPGGQASAPENTRMGTPEYAFRLSVPSNEINVDQGEAKKFEVEVKKGKNFTQDVEVTFADLPPGVTVSPALFTIGANDKEDDKEVSVAATKDAPKGSYSITVIGRPKTGDTTKTTLKIKVD